MTVRTFLELDVFTSQELYYALSCKNNSSLLDTVFSAMIIAISKQNEHNRQNSQDSSIIVIDLESTHQVKKLEDVRNNWFEIFKDSFTTFVNKENCTTTPTE